jgi:signal transduction histidine kinase
MDPSAQLHLAAGVGAAGLGVATWLQDPGRRRNRLFALLCAALAVWTVGAAMPGSGPWPDLPWHRAYLLGSCLAAPLALHFALAVTGRRRPPGLPLAVAYAAAVALWAAAWSPAPGRAWKMAAIVLLGSMLLAALGAVYRAGARLAPGPERRAYRWILAAGALAVAGGLSDFVPREWIPGFPYLGPPALLVFLLVVCAAVLRHRFLDVHSFLARAVALVAGAAAVAFVFHTVVRLTGGSFVVLFGTAVVVLLLARPVRQGLVSGMRGLLSSADPTAEALLSVSRRLASAESRADVWNALDAGREALPQRVRAEVFLRSRDGDRFEARYRSKPDEAGEDDVEADGAVPVFLGAERGPVTRSWLDREALEPGAERARQAGAAAEAMERRGDQMAVPLLRGERLEGWIAVAGLPGKAVTADVAAAFLAVGNQAVAALDRAEARESAERRRAMAAVGEMASGLAHEIRNPLAAIHGAVEALGPEAGPEDSKEMLEVIHEESARLGRVVGEFLEYARAGSPRREAVDLEAMAGRVARSAKLAGMDLTIRIEAAPGTPPAWADPHQVQRVFENLVRNAWQAAGTEGTLRIVLQPGDAGGVALRFEDDGPGMSEDDAAGCFEPFRTSRPDGTGLGLALVHRVVEQHGGTIRVEGRPGSGAAFVLTLPSEEAAP